MFLIGLVGTRSDRGRNAHTTALKSRTGAKSSFVAVIHAVIF